MEKSEFEALVAKYQKELMDMANKNTDVMAVQANVSTDEDDGKSVYEERPEPKTYEQFLQQNHKTGSLKIQAFTGDQAIPVSNVTVVISKKFGNNERVFYTAKTNEDGIIDGITLPAPDKNISMSPSEELPYADYDIKANHPSFQDQSYPGIPIFDGVKSIQPIKLIPKGI